jgi:hypothetical protein
MGLGLGLPPRTVTAAGSAAGRERRTTGADSGAGAPWNKDYTPGSHGAHRQSRIARCQGGLHCTLDTHEGERGVAQGTDYLDVSTLLVFPPSSARPCHLWKTSVSRRAPFSKDDVMLRAWVVAIGIFSSCSSSACAIKEEMKREYIVSLSWKALNDVVEFGDDRARIRCQMHAAVRR